MTFACSPKTESFSVPPNVQFMIDDAEDSWVFSHKFDLIHARLMAGAFADWPKFFGEAYRYVSVPDCLKSPLTTYQAIWNLAAGWSSRNLLCQ